MTQLKKVSDLITTENFEDFCADVGLPGLVSIPNMDPHH